MKALLLILIFISLSYAEGIDSLLTDYEKESELSNKTKDESAGNLIVYTRDDLERMQVETLKDILKSFRFFPYAENRTSHPDILSQDPLSYASKSVRIYLNETELITSITGNGFFLFGDMEMDFIDHVEIYEGFPSFDFGVEPATTVIRLYSKTAEHDEGGRVKVTIDNKGANKQNVYYADKTDDISYFMYANHTGKKQDTYEHHGETLGRDKETNRFYGSLSTQNHNVEL
ncbi:MAG: Plug domain-containing protein, partial [Sulfurimonas sp.]|nr:Plug domain-containing protein [Sulfurimonas sp.]